MRYTVSVLTTAIVLAGCAGAPPTGTARFDIPETPSASEAVRGGNESPAASPATAGAPITDVNIGAGRPRPSDYRANEAMRVVHFDFDQADVRPEDRAVLDRNAGWLMEHPRARVLIEAHADERGTNEYNVALSDKRARSTKSYLMSKGIRGDRVAMIGYGEERPLCLDATTSCYARNRRASFMILE